MISIIRNAMIINEGKIFNSDVFIRDQKIEKIGSGLNTNGKELYKEINAEGLYLLPGLIDAQVHFREPGLTHKGTIYSEAMAAVAGGITSYMDMPNTIPNTLTIDLLEDKYELASRNSLANYSFFMGINRTNLKEALRINTEKVCGITDDGLYFDNDEGILSNYPDFLEQLFLRKNILVALHSEEDIIIKNNIKKYREIFGDSIPFDFHSKIRNEEACFASTKRVLDIAKKYNNRLHFLHISTLAEANLFDNITPVHLKRITAEACIHHLWFSTDNYKELGNKIKWNPSVKKMEDKAGLLQSLLNNKLDTIATDHAPHTIQEKSGNYFEALPGGPLVQHALPVLLELYHKKQISLEKIVEKTSHAVAEIYKIRDRGYIREGYYADLVLVDLNSPWTVTNDNILYNCKWSPFENYSFKSSVVKTFVNGHLAYSEGIFYDYKKGMRLLFAKDR